VDHAYLRRESQNLPEDAGMEGGERGRGRIKRKKEKRKGKERKKRKENVYL
jgi:hypothetical protein